MTSLIRTEWLKIKFYRPFWFLLGSYSVSLFGIVLLSLWGQSKAQKISAGTPVGEGLSSNLPMAFPQVWHNLSYMASWMYFIPTIILILNLSNEFAFRTHRQNIIEGWSRTRFLVAKLMVGLCLSLFCTLNVLLAILLSGLASPGELSLAGFHYVFRFFAQTTLYLLVGLLICFVIRRAALSVAAFFLYSVILENLGSLILSWKFDGLGSYLPLNVASGLLPVPYYEENVPAAAKALFFTPSEMSLMVAGAIYTILIIGFLWYRFSREDL